MSENTKTTVMTDEKEQALYNEFNTTYSAKVHKIGRITLCIALVLSFLPVAYMYFVLGWRVPVSTYITVIFTLTALCVGMWITEPLTWYPILGAAPTYMAYLAGNVKNIRVPVARSVMKKYGERTDTPRGQVLATFAVGVSVIVNLVILTVIVLTGSYFVPLLPPIVLTALSYVVPSLIGALLWFRIEESGWITTLKWSIIPVTVWFVVRALDIMVLSDIGEALSIAITILVGYITYKASKKNVEEE